MLKRLHLFVIKSYLGPLVFTFFISVFILLMQFLWKYIEDLVGKGFEWTVIAELLLYASASLVPMALPLAILLASIMVFGNMGEHYELIAMKASGISLLRIMKPLIVFSIFLSIAAFLFSNYILPITNLRTGSLLYDVSHQRAELNIKQGVFNSDIENYSIKISRKNPKTGMIYDFMIYDHSENKGNAAVTVADSGTIKITDDQRYMIMELYHGMNYMEQKEKKKINREYPHRSDSFEKQTFVFELVGFGFQRTDRELFKSNFQMLNLRQLNLAIDSLSLILNSREEMFYQNLLRTNYLKRKEHKALKATTSDSTKTTKKSAISKKKIVWNKNLDSLFAQENDREKKNILSNAISNALSTQRYAASSETDQIGRYHWILRHYVEWHKKFNLAFACLIFFFIGAPLGAIIRKGGLGLPVVISVVFFIFYYVMSTYGEKFTRAGIMPASQGMWIASVLLLIIGIFLTYKAVTDSSLFHFEVYVETLKSWKKKLKSTFAAK